MHTLAILLIGYSLLCALSVATTHFRPALYPQMRSTRALGWCLLLALAALQGVHLAWLQFELNWVDGVFYRMMLFAVAPLFFLFSRSILRGQARPELCAKDGLHGLPIALAVLLPAAVALPLAFLVGATYLMALAKRVAQLRAQRASFGMEIRALAVVFVIALGVTVLGVMQSDLPNKLFYSLYASSIGLAFFLVQLVLSLRPSMAEQVQETVRASQQSYVATTLAHVDCDAAITLLNQAMSQDQRYADHELKLATLAQAIGLSGHQLSELLNTRIGKSFARYLREQRVAAAKVMLIAEPKASVLSVGLAVGFVSQSSFYDAFRELEGMTPGQFRQIQSHS